MTPFVERQNLSLIDTGAADASAQFLLRMWIDNKGIVVPGRQLNALSPSLILMHDTAAPGDSPEMMFFGAKTLFSKYYPESEDYAESNPKQLLATKFRSLVSEGYQTAINGEPHYDIIGTGALLGSNRPEVIYERLVLPFNTKKGFRNLFCLTIERECLWLDDQSDRKRNSQDFQQKKDRGRWLTAPRPM